MWICMCVYKGGGLCVDIYVCVFVCEYIRGRGVCVCVFVCV